jgi:hypothetical protein
MSVQSRVNGCELALLSFAILILYKKGTSRLLAI